MSNAPAERAWAAISEVLTAPRVSHVVAVASIGVGFLADALQRLIGWPGLLAIVITLVVIAALTLVARGGLRPWLGLLPVSLVIFLGWAGVSVFWSSYRWATLAGLGYLVAFTALGIYVALMRDTIQIVRAFGDVLRFVLGVSLAVEIFSGVLIDAPIRFLGVEGRLAELGPIQGLMSTRNQLGLVAVLAIVTFAMEFLTRSVERQLAIGSMVLAGVSILLSRSPIIAGVAVALGAAVLALHLIRRAKPERRVIWQWGTLGVAVLLALIAWLVRTPIIAALSANAELTYRISLWRALWNLGSLSPLEGWGWIGQWRPDLAPFTFFAAASNREPTSAVNAYVDVWFQLGLAGLFIFAVLVGLAFVRSWLLAGRRRSIVFMWPALMLVVLIVSALAESSLLVEYGWLTFVVCCVKAARELSWRRALSNGADDESVGPQGRLQQ